MNCHLNQRKPFKPISLSIFFDPESISILITDLAIAISSKKVFDHRPLFLTFAMFLAYFASQLVFSLNLIIVTLSFLADPFPSVVLYWLTLIICFLKSCLFIFCLFIVLCFLS